MHLRWGKQHGTLRRPNMVASPASATDFLLNLIAYNLTRIPKLLTA